MPWPTGTTDSLAREFVVSFTLKVPHALGIGYVHPALYFRDRRNNQRIWITLQAFDSRSGISQEYVTSDGFSPIVVTSFGRSGSFGRSVFGSLSDTTWISPRSYEYRLNGFQFENALDVAGCSSSDLTRLSCSAEDFQLTIGFVELETAAAGSEIGATVSNLGLRRTNPNVFQ